MTKFRVTLSFDVDIAPIALPDADVIEGVSASGSKKASPGKPEKELMKKNLIAAMRKKGMSDEQIAETLTQKSFQKSAQKPPNYQMLLYPQYERWASAQQRVQDAILSDETMSRQYVQEVTRDLIRGRIDSMLDDACGEPGLLAVLERALATLSAEDREILKADQTGLIFDETELLDGAVSYEFVGVDVDRV